MRQFALMALLLPSVANAGSFLRLQLPVTNTFSYDWSSVGVMGDTAFVFDNGVRDTTGVACNNVDGCMDGTFSTGNLGQGVFVTDIRLDACSLIGSPSAYFGVFTRQRLRCDIHQTVELIYDDTGATYTGEAPSGDITWWAVFSPSGAYLGILNQIAGSTLSSGLFSGTLSGPATGTFTEL